MSPYFVRILNLGQVNVCIKMLNGVSDEKVQDIKKGDVTFVIKAPDGDMVFSGLLAPRSKERYVCRLHREVFKE